jgi:phosphohistidine phosphatase SixA
MATVLLVRHADIDPPSPPGTDDPDLNGDGRARAEELARAVGAAGVTHIFTSSFSRTKQTVAPLAAQCGLQAQEAPSGSSLAQAILSGAVGPVVLVAGHSNTVPQLIADLGAPAPVPAIGDREFDNLFVVTITDPMQVSSLHLKYGAVSVDQN